MCAFGSAYVGAPANVPQLPAPPACASCFLAPPAQFFHIVSTPNAYSNTPGLTRWSLSPCPELFPASSWAGRLPAPHARDCAETLYTSHGQLPAVEPLVSAAASIALRVIKEPHFRSLSRALHVQRDAGDRLFEESMRPFHGRAALERPTEQVELIGYVTHSVLKRARARAKDSGSARVKVKFPWKRCAVDLIECRSY